MEKLTNPPIDPLANWNGGPWGAMYMRGLKVPDNFIIKKNK